MSALEPVLNELSIPDTAGNLHTQAARLDALLEVLRGLWRLGLPRVLRMSRDAMSCAICDGHTLRDALFRSGLGREQKLLLARVLDKAPYVDRLIASRETRRQEEGAEEQEVDGMCAGAACDGLVYVALTDGISASLPGNPVFEAATLPVELEILSGDASALQVVTVTVLNASEAAHVAAHEGALREHLQQELTSGGAVLARAGDIFPRLRFGRGAEAQLGAITGNEQWFSQLLVHLRALNQGAEGWSEGAGFAPVGAIEWSPESQTTLDHGTYGPQRDFAVPTGVSERRFSLHSKICSGNQRVYFSTHVVEDSDQKEMTVIIGYIGHHLPTVKYN